MASVDERVVISIRTYIHTYIHTYIIPLCLLGRIN